MYKEKLNDIHQNFQQWIKDERNCFFEIWPIQFYNDDPINAQLENTRKNQLNYNPNPHYILLYTQYNKQPRQVHLTCW